PAAAADNATPVDFSLESLPWDDFEHASGNGAGTLATADGINPVNASVTQTETSASPRAPRLMPVSEAIVPVALPSHDPRTDMSAADSDATPAVFSRPVTAPAGAVTLTAGHAPLACDVDASCIPEDASYLSKISRVFRDKASLFLGKKREQERKIEYVFEFPTVLPSGCPYGYYEPNWQPFCDPACPPSDVGVRIFDRAHVPAPARPASLPAPAPVLPAE
ncbi:MAG: hypothetical protein AAGJ97_03435, partial [Planctomycetota bacterium]